MAINDNEHEHFCFGCKRELKHYFSECRDPKAILCAECLAEAFTDRNVRISRAFGDEG